MGGRTFKGRVKLRRAPSYPGLSSADFPSRLPLPIRFRLERFPTSQLNQRSVRRTSWIVISMTPNSENGLPSSAMFAWRSSRKEWTSISSAERRQRSSPRRLTSTTLTDRGLCPSSQRHDPFLRHRYQQRIGPRLGMRKGAVGIAPITNELGVLGDDRQQVGCERAGCEVVQHVVRGRAASVADDEGTVVLIGDSPLFLAVPPRFLGTRPTSSPRKPGSSGSARRPRFRRLRRGLRR